MLDLAGVFLYKSSSRTKHNWHCIIGFFVNAALLNVYFNHSFFRKNKYFFECLCFNEYDVRMSLQLLKDRGSSEMRTAPYRDRGYHASCMRTHLHYLFSWFGQHLCVLAARGVCEKRLFFSNKINFCCHEISFYYNT